MANAIILSIQGIRRSEATVNKGMFANSMANTILATNHPNRQHGINQYRTRMLETKTIVFPSYYLNQRRPLFNNSPTKCGWPMGRLRTLAKITSTILNKNAISKSQGHRGRL